MAVPAITSVSASSEFSGDFAATKAVDRNVNAYWVANTSTGKLLVQYASAFAARAYYVTMSPNEPNRAPRDWTFEGSNNGTDFTVLDTRTAQTSWTTPQQTRYFTFSNATPYAYYRLNVTANNGDGLLAVDELWVSDVVAAPGSGAYPTAVMADSPRAFFRWSETSGSMAEDCSNSHISPVDLRGGYTRNGAALIADGDPALTLATNGYGRLVSDGGLVGMAALTIDAVIRLTSLADFSAIAASDNNTQRNWIFRVDPNGALTFVWWASSGAGPYTLSSAAAAITTGATYHVAVTHDGTSAVKLYVNGSQVASSTQTGGIASARVNVGTFGFNFGAQHGPAYFLNGRLDDVAIYPTALSAARIAAHSAAVSDAGGTSVTGTVAGTSPAGVGSLTGTVPVPTVTGTVAGTSPVGVGSMTGTAPTTGTIAGTSPAGSGSLTGATSSTTTGTIAGTSPAGSGSLTGSVTPPPAEGVVYVSAPSPRNATVALGDGGVTFDMDVLTIAARSEREARVSLILTPAAVPVVINEWPIERQAHLMPALSAVQPRMRPHVDYSVEYGIVGRDHVFVDGQDVTFLRGCPTMIGETVESSPLGDDRASLEFPQVKPWDIPGEGDLWMLREDAPVEIVRITPEGDRVHRFDGFLSSFSDSSGDGREAYTIECEGVLAQAMHEPWEPPLFLDETDIGKLIPRALNAVPGRRWAKIPETVTGFTSSDRGSQDQSVWQQVQNWLAPAWTTDGRQLALVRVAHGVYRLQLKEPTTTVHWTVTKGAPGVSVDLVHDSNTRRDSVYGRGVAPDGGVWANWFFPFLDQFVPPQYPMAGFANMSVGTTDADTTNGRGVTQWQRRMRELGYNVRVDGVMNSSDTTWILRVQKAKGITVDGSLGPQTWNATFDPGPTEVDLRAVRRPLATKTQVEPYLYAANGARTGKNPAYDSRIIRHAMPGVNFGAGMRKRDTFAPAADILAREGTTGATGTITLSTDPHEADSSRLDIRAGHNVKVVGHRGETVVQVASVSHGLLSSTLTVDERARDALAVEAILERSREARKNVSNRRGSYTRDQLDKAEVVQYESESQAGTLPRYAVNGNSGLWSVVPIFVSQVGVAKIRLEASPNAEIVCALFSRPITPNRLKSFVPNPLSSSEGWYDAVETLKGKYGCMEVFGTPDSPGGYSPEQKGDGPLTGVLEDESSTLYDSGYGGVVWVALYTSRSTWVEGRIFPAVPQ